MGPRDSCTVLCPASLVVSCVNVLSACGLVFSICSGRPSSISPVWCCCLRNILVFNTSLAFVSPVLIFLQQPPHAENGMLISLKIFKISVDNRRCMQSRKSVGVAPQLRLELDS